MSAPVFAGVLAPEQILSTPEAKAPFLKEQRGRYDSVAPLVLLPDSTAQVAAIVQTARQHGLSIVPQGGNTGLVGGSVATEERQVVVNLQRMKTIRQLSPANFTITVDAGCTLQQVQEQAATVGLQFPLGLSVATQAQIGGTLATNAGGLNALRYGTARLLVLGLEGVMADGTVVSDLTAVRKNNQGLDVKQLLIGSEGTLGIITAATLMLVPAFVEESTLAIFCDTPQAAIEAYRRSRTLSDDRLVAAELIAADAVRLVQRHRPALPFPWDVDWPWLLLIKLASHKRGGLAMVADTMADVLDAAVPGARTFPAFAEEEDVLWAYRRELPWVQREAGASLKHDIALPLDTLPVFLEQAGQAVRQHLPEVTLIPFGHLGDGNIHYNIQQPAGMAKEAFLAHRDAVQDIVHRLVMQHGGTFSAEHGIGLAKKEALARYGDVGSLLVRRAVKQALDPDGILNPGKIF